MVTFDGKLYNRESLIKELSIHPQFSDAEIIGAAYDKWGTECVKKFQGVFAFAIEKANEIFMARDPLGVKRIFYNKDVGIMFAFSIHDLPMKHCLDRKGAASLLLLGPGRTPGDGILRGVKELLPGQWVMYTPEKGFKSYIYWKPKAQPHLNDFKETVAHVRDLVKEAITHQTKSVQTVCAFLSGGLDSSAIAAISGVRETFSVDYADNDRHFKASAFQPDDDKKFIESMTGFLGTTHHSLYLETDELANAIDEAVYARAFPGMGDVDASLLLFCRWVKERADVALSGEGADEIFGGYPWYRDEKRLWEDAFPWSQSTGYRAGFAAPGMWDGFDPEEYVREKYEQAIKEAEHLPGETVLEKRMRQMFMLNIQWFGQTLLERHDRMSSYVGLEVRMPFCDPQLVSYLYNVPWEFKNFRGREKGLLREALKDWLPDDVLWRKKSPYPKTHNPAYWSAISEMMRALLAEADAPLFDIVDRNAVVELLENKESGTPWYGQLMTAPQTVAYFLQINAWLLKNKIKIDL